MKTNSLRSMVLENRWRCAILLSAFLSLICLAITSGSAQAKNPKRVTALQVGAAAGGSRVTIVSDSPLNDYEAFRRGDRFYVRIPSANFTAAQPSFRSNGFEDVRVQKVGDDVIVSFKLQPGASARVDQRSNRLEVVFAALGTSPTGTAANSFPTTRNRRNTGNADAIAGPMPPTSPPTFNSRNARTGRISYPASSRNNLANSSAQAPRNARTGRTSSPSSRENSSNNILQAPRSNRSKPTEGNRTSAATNNKGNSTAEKLPLKTKQSIGSPTSSPGTSGSVSTLARPTPFSTPTVFATPTTANVQQPAVAPVSASSRTPEATGWDSRIKFLKAWATLNRSALMVGGLIALALLIALVLWSRLKGRRTALAKASGKTKAKPTAEKVVGPGAIEGELPAGTPNAAPAVTGADPHKEAWVRQPAPAGFATSARQEHRQADKEREVFEL